MMQNNLLKCYEKSKNQIRNSCICGKPSNYMVSGIDMAVKYSELVKCTVRKLFNVACKNAGISKGISAYLYGSPGRYEMLCESDLDLMLIYKENSFNILNFRSKFVNLLKPFNFCKIDIPEWGSIQECKLFAKNSITEGNQVIENRFVCGDKEINNIMISIQEKYGNPYRMMRNIVFQKFYFEQYYSQRIRDGNINIKYCDGGSRDYLFIHWFNQYMKRKDCFWNKSSGKRPVAEQGLTNLYYNNMISKKDYNRALDSLNFNIILRNEVLLINKGTLDEGLTFLDLQTCKFVFRNISGIMKAYDINSPIQLKKTFDVQRTQIAKIKYVIWRLILNEINIRYNNKFWAKNFCLAYSKSTPESQRIKYITSDNVFIKIAVI